MKDHDLIAAANPRYRYGIDRLDVIRWVDPWWLAFAKENGAANLTEDAVVGRSVWDFISGEPTQKLYAELHGYVRSLGRPIRVPFRCDSPLLQRHMRATIEPQEHGGLLYECELLRVKPQQPQPLLDVHLKRSDNVLTMCSCCKKSLWEPSGWLDLENIALRLRTFDQQTVPALRYTICPECESSIDTQREQPSG